MAITTRTPEQRQRRRRIITLVLVVAVIAVVGYQATWGNYRFTCEHNGGTWAKVGERSAGRADVPVHRCVTKPHSRSH